VLQNPDPDVHERTAVMHDPQEITKETLHSMDEIKKNIDGCVDEKGPSVHVSATPIWNKFIECHNRGVKIRFITEITDNNIPHCKQIMQIAELRHLDEIKGNFGIGDGRLYHASSIAKEGQIYPHFIISTVKEFVQQQQYFFDMLWKKVIPAKQRIKEIEQGLKREFIDTIQDPYETQKILDKLLESALRRF
jgi:two-component system, OmpR family, sensor histidine kinase VicK